MYYEFDYDAKGTSKGSGLNIQH